MCVCVCVCVCVTAVCYEEELVTPSSTVSSGP